MTKILTLSAHPARMLAAPLSIASRFESHYDFRRAIVLPHVALARRNGGET